MTLNLRVMRRYHLGEGDPGIHIGTTRLRYIFKSFVYKQHDSSSSSAAARSRVLQSCWYRWSSYSGLLSSSTSIIHQIIRSTYHSVRKCNERERLKTNTESAFIFPDKMESIILLVPGKPATRYTPAVQ